MNKPVCFALGAALGGAASFLALKGYYSNKLREAMRQEREYYNTRLKEKESIENAAKSVDIVSDSFEKLGSASSDFANNLSRVATSVKEAFTKGIDPISYNKYAKLVSTQGYSAGPQIFGDDTETQMKSINISKRENAYDDEEYLDDPVTVEEDVNVNPDGYYQIGAGDFAETCQEYDKETYYLYTRDFILADSCQNVDRELQEKLGELLNKHDRYEPNVLYLRNDGLEIDIEIIREDRSYIDRDEED